MSRLVRGAVLALALVFIAAFARGAEDEAYTLKFKDLEKGQAASYEFTDVSELVLRVFSGDESLADQKVKISGKAVFWEQVTEKSEGQPATRVRRGYGEARYTLDDNTKILPVEGKRVTIKRTKGKPTYKIEGVDAIDTKEAQILESDFGDPVGLNRNLPDKAIKVNQSWRFNAREQAAELAKGLKEIEFDIPKASGIGQLNRIYEKDGRRFGKVTIHIEIPLKAIKVASKRIPLAATDKVVVQTVYDCCIDGSAHIGSFKAIPYLSVTASLTEKGQKLTVACALKGERKVTFTELVKKKAEK